MLGRHDHDPRLKTFACKMRKEPTEAERKLWSILRSPQFAGFRFRRQHPVAGYIVDFICVKENLVIELDGGQHLDPEQLAYDAKRTKRLAEASLRVMRIFDHDMMRKPEAVARVIFAELTSTQTQMQEPSP